MKKRAPILLLLLVIVHHNVPAQNTSARLTGSFFQTIVNEDPIIASCLNDKVWGNCVVIALIKTAIAEFKTVAGIYKSFTVSDDKINIIFNDGLNVELTSNDLRQAEQFAAFGRGTDPVFFDSAIIVYASICKRVQVHKAGVIEKHKHCVNSFQDAMHFINSGYATDGCGVLLGLRLVEKDVADIPGLETAIIRTSAHTAYCTHGTQDINGQPFIVRNGKMKNPIGGPKRIKRVFVLSK